MFNTSGNSRLRRDAELYNIKKLTFLLEKYFDRVLITYDESDFEISITCYKDIHLITDRITRYSIDQYDFDSNWEASILIDKMKEYICQEK